MDQTVVCKGGISTVEEWESISLKFTVGVLGRQAYRIESSVCDNLYETNVLNSHNTPKSSRRKYSEYFIRPVAFDGD